MHRSAISFAIAVAALAPWLPSRACADSFLGKSTQQWLSELESRDAKTRRAAAFALGKLGVDAYDGVPRLTRALNDADATVREAAAFALAEIGPAAGSEPVESLAKLLLGDKDPQVRRSAACALGSLGPTNVPSTTSLRKALHDPEAVVRQNAAWALGQLSRSAPGQPDLGFGTGTISELSHALADRDPVVRRDAAEALGTIGRRAHGSLQALVKSFRQDGDAVVRKTALSAMVNVAGPDDHDVAPDLVAALKDPDPENARSAALALGNIGGADVAAAVPVLRTALHDPDARAIAAAALANVGPEAAPALPELRATLKDSDPEVRRNAALAIGHIGERAGDAAADLAALLDPKQPEPVRYQAAEALAGIGPGCEPAVAPLLRTLRSDVQPRIRQRALWALAQVPNLEGHEIVTGFESVLSDNSAEFTALRYEAARLLGMRLQSRTPEKAIDVLQEMLANTDLVIYERSNTRINTSGAEARDAKATTSSPVTGDGRALAAEALARIGPRLKRRPEIISALRGLQNSSDKRLREAVHDALRQIGVER